MLGSSAHFGSTCLHIAGEQSSLPQAMKWLTAGVEAGYDMCKLILVSIVYASNPGVVYKRDEVAFVLSKMKEDLDLVCENVSDFDPSGSQASRFLVRILLSGSLTKNRTSVLYQSFFSSSIRETHLLPVISKYLKGNGRAGNELFSEENSKDITITFIESIQTLFTLSLLLLRDTSSLLSLSFIISYKSDNIFMSFLPLLLTSSRLPMLKKLDIAAGANDLTLDLSSFASTDTSTLEKLCIINFSINSLSPLSHCDFSSLRELILAVNSGLRTLDGLTKRNTQNLKILQIRGYDLVDISSLSLCDFSSLECLSFLYCKSLSDLSPLRGLDFSSLKRLDLNTTKVSDLSPLCECKGFAPQEIQLPYSPIADLSPLSLLDLSRLRKPISLYESNVSDLSPLENISCDGTVSVDVSQTPAERKMEIERRKSPHTIGTVRVTWGQQ